MIPSNKRKSHNKGMQSDSATCHFLCKKTHKKRQVATQLMPALHQEHISNTSMKFK